jgi:ElaB/YqjD/DUF883 family membrane-anchored ribosome-binding protein
MAPNDAEMPDYQTLNEDLEEMRQRLATLRQAVDNLTHSIGRAGSHQAERLQDQTNETVGAMEDAIRRDPLKSLAIALGIGFLVGVLRR